MNGESSVERNAKRHKRRRPLPDVPASASSRHQLGRQNVGVMTQTDLDNDLDILHENQSGINNPSSTSGENFASHTVFDVPDKTEDVFSKKAVRSFVLFIPAVVAITCCVLLTFYLLGLFGNGEFASMNSQINNSASDEYLKEYVGNETENQQRSSKETNGSKLKTMASKSHPMIKEKFSDVSVYATPTHTLPDLMEQRNKVQPHEEKSHKGKKQNNLPENNLNLKHKIQKSNPRHDEPSRVYQRPSKPPTEPNRRASDKKQRHRTRTRGDKAPARRENSDDRNKKADVELVFNGKSLSLSRIDAVELNGDSAFKNEVDAVDEDARRSDDQTVFYDKQRATMTSPLCSRISDSRCARKLSYTSSLRKTALNRSVAQVTSKVMRRLQSDLNEQNVRERSSRTSRCDAETAEKFLCAIKYPKCKQDGTISFPCASWCVDVLTSCLSDTSLMTLHKLRHHNSVVHAKSRSRLEQIPNVRSMTRFLDISALIGWSCEAFLDDDTNTSPTHCLSPETLKSLNKEAQIVIESRPKPSNASCSGFLCLRDRCIDLKWVCDGNNDCGEWEDERDCACSYNQFQCSSNQCIEQDKICDGFYDCLDKSDETNCEICAENLTSCGNRQCIFSDWLCDGDMDCQNGRDEIDCSCESMGLVPCDQGGCFSQSSKCDGYQDCHDNSDEKDCDDTEQTRCPAWSMTCDRSCLSITKQCDGIIDCFNRADEKNCGKCEEVELEVCSSLTYEVTMLPNFIGHMTQSQISRSSEYLQLSVLARTKCHDMIRELGCYVLVPPVPLAGDVCPKISKIKRRQRVLPCRSLCLEVWASCQAVLATAPMQWPSFLQCGNFPEISMNSTGACLDARAIQRGMCSADEFRCVKESNDRIQCVTMTSRCDGKQQCADGSDEEDCDCRAMGRFRCVTGGRCIAREWVCDSHRDCSDGSDEQECSQCSSSQRACLDYSCVDFNRWCDGNDDCSDGSDEANCLSLVPRGLLRTMRALQPPSGSSIHNIGVLVAYDVTNSEWLPICSDSWVALLSHLACNQMGFRDAASLKLLRFHFPKTRSSKRQPITIARTSRIRRVQESFSRRNRKCRGRKLIHLKCRPKICGRQYNSNHDTKVSARIMGGRTSRDNRWPWLASLQLQGMNHVCGATVVGPYWAVSAAHCFQERKEHRIWRIKISSSSATFNVSKIIIHPRYDSQAMDFDIALVRTERLSNSFHSDSLCLPSLSFGSGSFCVIADSGGPLMCWQPRQLQWQLAGITSWGSSCTPNSAPGVYTDVRYFFDWIKSTTELG